MVRDSMDMLRNIIGIYRSWSLDNRFFPDPSNVIASFCRYICRQAYPGGYPAAYHLLRWWSNSPSFFCLININKLENEIVQLIDIGYRDAEDTTRLRPVSFARYKALSAACTKSFKSCMLLSRIATP